MLGSKRPEKDLLMSFENVAIRVSGLSKCYQIYDRPGDRLKQFIYPKLANFFGQKVRNYYREFWALRGVSLEIKKGETVGIIGRNGSGKSTLLQMICGTLNPTGGHVEINGRVAALLELGSGFNPEFTGRENIYMNAAVLGLKLEEINNKYEDIVSFADIGDFIEQPVKTYSSGMIVRLAFAVIAHVDADILVVDEALAVGDVFFAQKCMRFLREFMKTKSVIFVSHDTSAIANLCTRAALISEGELRLLGNPKRVIDQYMISLYESIQDINGGAKYEVGFVEEVTQKSTVEARDFREDIINQSHLRNDIEVFSFDLSQAGFGAGGAQIKSTKLYSEDGAEISWVLGGTAVVLQITCLAHTDIDSAIIGFQLQDRLGQVIFCDNTYLSNQMNPIFVKAGSTVEVKFSFKFPILPAGDYTISPAIAQGTQENHVQHHWIHDALSLKVHSSHAVIGLIGLPMKKISLNFR